MLALMRSARSAEMDAAANAPTVTVGMAALGYVMLIRVTHRASSDAPPLWNTVAVNTCTPAGNVFPSMAVSGVAVEAAMLAGAVALPSLVRHIDPAPVRHVQSTRYPQSNCSGVTATDKASCEPPSTVRSPPTNWH
jgi:hypothetical protein